VESGSSSSSSCSSNSSSTSTSTSTTSSNRLIECTRSRLRSPQRTVSWIIPPSLHIRRDRAPTPVVVKQKNHNQMFTHALSVDVPSAGFGFFVRHHRNVCTRAHNKRTSRYDHRHCGRGTPCVSTENTFTRDHVRQRPRSTENTFNRDHVHRTDCNALSNAGRKFAGNRRS